MIVAAIVAVGLLCMVIAIAVYFGLREGME